MIGGVFLRSNFGSIYATAGAGPNVVARGYSYFEATNGTIGVGSPAGAPGVPGDVTPAAYNPLRVDIQVLPANLGTGANPGGNNSALPVGLYGGNIPPSALTLLMGGAVPSGYADVFPHGGSHGPLGISGSIQGLVRPGIPANFYTQDVTPMVLGAPGYVFYEDIAIPGTAVMAPYQAPVYGVPIGGYDISRQIFPIIPGAPATPPGFLGNFMGLFADPLKFRIPPKGTVDAFQISPTQGPSALANAPVFFYHPLIEMSMYELPALGLDMYEFIDGRINHTNPALLPLVEEE